MDDKKISVEVRTPINAPPEYKQHALMAARRKFGNELFDILWGYKLPAVVDIEEEDVTDHYRRDFHYYDNVLRITATVTPVQHRHFEIAHMSSLPSLPYMALYPPKNKVKHALQRIAYFIAEIASK